MLQFYFLSVILNALIGFLFFFRENDAFQLKSVILFENGTFKLVIGILSMVIGLLKLLSPIEGDIPIIGDLLPAISGFLCGLFLLLEYYSKNSSIEETEQTKTMLMVFFAANQKIVGAVAIIVAVLHFLFPRVLLI